MSDNRGLIGKLLKLGAAEAPDRDGWRRIGRPLDRDLLAAILREIDETQLPRTLRFRDDGGQGLHVEAGNRRLRRIVSSDAASSDSAKKLLGQVLAHASEVDLAGIGDLLRGFQPGDQAVWVRSEELSQQDESPQSGVTAEALAKALSVDIDDRADANLRQAFETFVEDLTPEASAWVRYKAGEEIAAAEQISEAWHDRWRDADLAGLQDVDEPTGFAPMICIFGSGNVGEPHDIVAQHGETRVVWRLAVANVVEIATTWRACGL